MRRLALAVAALCLLGAGDTAANRPLPEYRYFRSLSIDLQGRPATRAEIASFEQPDFDLDKWLDAHLSGPGYAERLRRVYMDLLRLDISPTMKFDPPQIVLGSTIVHGPDDKPLTIHFRWAQRRVRPELDGQICFTEAEIGVRVPNEGPAIGTLHPVSQKLLDERTVLVKPWWLYSDYRSASPSDHIAVDWAQRFPGYELFLPLFIDPDKTATTTIRVCKEEAQTAEMGHVFATGRTANKKDPILPGRLTRLPADTGFAKANPGRLVSCVSQTGFQSSTECGCGVGLERCLPGWPNGFMLPVLAPLGRDQSFFATPRPAAAWLQSWWGEEAIQFIETVFAQDRDVRELLTSHSTVINGPLAQFYRFFAPATCCAQQSDLGHERAEPLFDPAAVPSSLVPEDATTWTAVADRGPHAAGLLTMPIFLMKYGSRRARAHVLFNTFLCKDMIADTAKLVPSTEPDLMRRPGCKTCHRTLEPMAAYFSRVRESDWTYLPAPQFPISLEQCRAADPAKMSATCKIFYDPAFTDATHTTLRGAYASSQNADAGPAGLAAELASSPEFAPCVVKNIAQSFIGRQLTPDDNDWKNTLVKTFVGSGYRARPLVRAILTSERYRSANNMGTK